MQHGAISVGETNAPAPARSARYSLKHLIAGAVSIALLTAVTIHYVLPKASMLHARRAVLSRSAMVMPPMDMNMMPQANNYPAYRTAYEPAYAPVRAAYRPEQPAYYPGEFNAPMPAPMIAPFNPASSVHGFKPINTCATMVGKGVCADDMTLNVQAVYRQCTHGLKATTCHCFGIKSSTAAAPRVILSNLFDNGLCRCLFSTEKLGSHWGMMLKCAEK